VSGSHTDDLLTVRVKHRLQRIELDVDVAVRREVMAVVGPSGAGKTSVLRAVAGLLRPDKARIEYAGRTLVDTERRVSLPPESRGVGMMFQDGALFPHLSIARNIEYGLRPRPRGRRERRARVAELLARYGIQELAAARPDKASGGERQRAALARAVATTPDILLLDEPLSALDSVTKARVSRELAQWLAELSLPTILVSHDYGDVVGLADRIAVIDEGKVVQVGTAADLMRAPASPFVAAFVGTNCFTGVARRDGRLTEVTVPGGARFSITTPASGKVSVVVDPWAVRLISPATAPAGPNTVHGLVTQTVPLGSRIRVTLGSDPPFIAEIPAEQAAGFDLSRGAFAAATWSPEAIRVITDERPPPTG